MIQQDQRKREDAATFPFERVTLASVPKTDDNVLAGGLMHNEFTAVFEQDGDWIISHCPEIPGANGQGHTREEARQNLAEAIALILEDRPAREMRLRDAKNT